MVVLIREEVEREEDLLWRKDPGIFPVRKCGLVVRIRGRFVSWIGFSFELDELDKLEQFGLGGLMNSSSSSSISCLF